MSRAQVEFILVIQGMHNDLKSVQENLQNISEKRKKEAKAREERESNGDLTE